MFCGKCGTELVENAKFCINCGSPVLIIDEPETTNIVENIQKGEIEEQNEREIENQDGIQKQNEDQNTLQVTQGENTLENEEQVIVQSSLDKEEIYRILIGKNADYYITAFHQLENNQKTKFMWSSLFANAALVLYRNCTNLFQRYYLFPLISQILAPFVIVVGFFMAQGDLLDANFISSITIYGVISTFSYIWVIISSIYLGKTFPAKYKKKLDWLIANTDCSTNQKCIVTATSNAGTSVERVIMAGVLFIILIIVSLAITTGAITAALDKPAIQESSEISTSVDENASGSSINTIITEQPTVDYFNELEDEYEYNYDNYAYDEPYQWIEWGESIAFDTCYVNIDSGALNMRSGPGTEYDIVGTLQQGEEIHVIDSYNGWCKAISADNGIRGFVAEQYIEYKTY